MTTWVQAHQRAAVLAAELHADLEINLSQQVNVFDAVDRMGLVLAFAPIGRVSGMYLPGGLSTGILINSEHPRTRQRFTAAHELGHHAFGHSIEIDREHIESTKTNVNRWTDDEKEAEAFGAWFLMPRRLIRAGMKDLGIERLTHPMQAYALSLWLGTSWTATARQLSATKLITESQEESWLTIEPKEMKAQILGSRTPAHFRQDVWRLNEHIGDRLVSATPGDQIVLSLDEIPSSGYMWRIENLPFGVRLIADSAIDDWNPANLEQQESETVDDITGNSVARSFLLEVLHSEESRTAHVKLVRDRAWDPGAPESSRFEISLAIEPKLSGVQVSPADFALTH